MNILLLICRCFFYVLSVVIAVLVVSALVFAFYYAPLSMLAHVGFFALGGVFILGMFSAFDKWS